VTCRKRSLSRLEIDVVPLTIRFGDEEFTDLSPDDFWAKCKVAKTLPETSAPSPGAFRPRSSERRRTAMTGSSSLTISSLLSATHQAAVLGAEAVASEIDVRVVDTLNVSMGEGLIVIDVAEAAKEGASASMTSSLEARNS
jgi:DegV family protein with EDD domain